MIIECPEMSHYRNSCRIGSFIRDYRVLRPQISSLRLFALYMSDSDLEEMNEKSLDLYHMYLGWHNLMNIPI